MGMRKKINEAVDWASVMKDNNANIDRLARLKTEVNIDPVMEEVIDETEKLDKNAEKVFKEVSKNSKDVTPEDPDTGKKITIKPYTEKLTLDESLFVEESEDDDCEDDDVDESLKESDYDRPGYEDMYLVSWEDSIGDYHETKVKAKYPQDAIDKIKRTKHIYKVIDVKKIDMFIAPSRIRKAELIENNKNDYSNKNNEESLKKSKHLSEEYNVREYTNRLFDMVEDGMLDAKTVLKSLMYWVSEDNIHEFMRLNDLLWDEDDEDDEDFDWDDDEDTDESLEEAKKSKQPKYWNSMFTTKVIDAYKNGKLTLDNIDEWETEYNGGVKPSNMGTKEILTYHINTGKDPRNESLEKKSLDEDWVLEPGKEYTSKSGNKIIIKSVIPYVSEYDGSASIEIDYDYELANGKTGSSTCNEKDLFNMLTESKNENLVEYVEEDQVEDDDYTVYDLLNDRLFGYGLNKSNFRLKWKFAEIEPIVKTKDGKTKKGYFYPTIHADEMVTGKADDRRAFVDDGVGVFVYDEDEASLAKKCAEELNLDFVLKKLIKPVNKFNYIAIIKVPEEIQEMPLEEYVESIGKSMKDFLRGKGEKVKSNFKDSANYKSRKDKKESE